MQNKYTVFAIALAVLVGCGSSTPKDPDESDGGEMYTVGGFLTGLAVGGSFVLQNNAGDDLELTQDGAFTFATKVAKATTYAVTIAKQPKTQTCTLTGGTGSVDGANVTNVTVTCVTNAVRLVFSSRRKLDGSDASNGSYYNLWKVNPDATGLAALTKFTADFAEVTDACWSPDGGKILFSSSGKLDGSDDVNQNAYSNVWVMNADGTGATPLTHLTAAYTMWPTWAPDGSKILFRSNAKLDGSDALNVDGTMNVWVMDANGTNRKPVTKVTVEGATTHKQEISPDGKRVVYASTHRLDGSDAASTPEVSNLFVVNLDGTGFAALTQTTAENAHNANPKWSPDGKTIVFEAYRKLDGSDVADPVQNIWKINVDGTGLTALSNLTTPDAFHKSPVFSPDGSTIMFISTRALNKSDALNGDGTYNLWTIKPDGSALTAVTKSTAKGISYQNATWSPDSKTLFFSANIDLAGTDALNTNDTSNIWSVKTDGGALSPLTNATANGAHSIMPSAFQ